MKIHGQRKMGGEETGSIRRRVKGRRKGQGGR